VTKVLIKMQKVLNWGGIRRQQLSDVGQGCIKTDFLLRLGHPYLDRGECKDTYPYQLASAPRYRRYARRSSVFLHSSKYSGFSACHPIHDDQIMYRALRHAIDSTIADNTETVTCSFHVGEEE